MKKIKVMSAILAVSLLAAGCSTSTKANGVEEIKKNNVLVVSTNAEFAPFEYLENNTYKGFDIDLIKAYGDYLGVKVEIKDMKFDAALLSLAKNKVDVSIAAITKNEKREKTLDFSDSYFDANQVVIVKDNSSFVSLETSDEIIAKLSETKAKIGCQKGTTGEYFIEGDADWDFEGIKGATCQAFDNGAMAVNALSNGQIDAVIIDAVPAKIYANKFAGVKVLEPVLTQEEYAIAVKKGNQNLLDSINEFIGQSKENGTFNNIVKTYFGE